MVSSGTHITLLMMEALISWASLDNILLRYERKGHKAFLYFPTHAMTSVFREKVWWFFTPSKMHYYSEKKKTKIFDQTSWSGWEGLTVEMSASLSFNGGNLAVISLLVIKFYIITLPPTQHHIVIKFAIEVSLCTDSPRCYFSRSVRGEGLDLPVFSFYYHIHAHWWTFCAWRTNRCYSCRQLWHTKEANGHFPLSWPISLVCMQLETKEALPAGSTVTRTTTELTEQNGWNTQDGRMAKTCGTRLCIPNFTRHFFVIPPSWVFQLSCCVSSLLLEYGKTFNCVNNKMLQYDWCLTALIYSLIGCIRSKHL